MKITQSDIAKHLGISVATVSRALRDDPSIPPETTAQVLEVAAALGYERQRRDGAKRKGIDTSGRGHRLVLVLVRVPQGADAWAPDEVAQGYIGGMVQAAASENISLVVHHVREEEMADLFDEYKRPAAFAAENLAGLILIHRFPPDVVRSLQQQHPLCAIVHDVPELELDVVDMEHYYGIRNMVKYLRAQGHSKLGFMGYRPQMTWSRARLSAFMESCFFLGLETSNDWIIHEADVDKAAALTRNHGITAWVCSVDVIAYPLVAGLKERGFAVPEEVEVTGFNAVTPLLDCDQIPSVKPAYENMGREALLQLVERIERPHAPAVRKMHRCRVVLPEKSEE